MSKSRSKIKLTVKCEVCKKIHEIEVFESDYAKYIAHELLIQDAFPYLTAGQRELLISGICGDCFDTIMNEPFESDF